MTEEIRLRASCPHTEFSHEFLQGMLNRMAMSYHRYGPAAAAYPDKIDALASLRDRLVRYAETGNIEWLIDAGNFAMLEYMLPSHPNAHFRATDSGDSPGRMTRDGRRSVRSNEDLQDG